MSNASSAIELQTPGVADIGDSDDTVRNGGHDEEHQLQSLPPVDGGFDAYAFLVGAFFIDALVWGMSNTFIPINLLTLQIIVLSNFFLRISLLLRNLQ